MNLQNIVVRVSKMELEPETNYDTYDPTTSKFGTQEVTKVQLFQEKGGPFRALGIFATVPADAPNPFTLGQRLTITIDAVDDIPPAITDQVVGLGERFDRDVVGVAAGVDGSVL